MTHHRQPPRLVARRLPLCVAIAAALATAFAPHAQAATFVWDGASGTSTWGGLSLIVGGKSPIYLTNWSSTGSAPPVLTGNNLVFAGTRVLDNTNNYVDLSVSNLSFAGGAGAFTLGGNTLNLRAGAGSTINNYSTNDQTFNLGITVTGTSVWSSSGSDLRFNGKVTVGDADLRLMYSVTIDNSSILSVGEHGVGKLSLEYGAKVVGTSYGIVGNYDGSHGTVNITGPGSQWNPGYFFIGSSSGSTGTLNISLGGAADSSDGSMLGLSSNTQGTVNITDLGSRWTLGKKSVLSVGVFGTGIVNIERDSVVSSYTAYVGERSGSNGTVKVSTSADWNNASDLHIGHDGTGTLTIESGGLVTSASGHVGANAGGNGTVKVTGANSLWTNASSLFIGDGGLGTLDIENGGVVSNTDGYLGYLAGSSGTVTLTGANSSWRNAGDLSVGPAGTGSLRILDSGKVTASKLSIGNKGTVTLDGGTLQVASASMSLGGIFNWIKGTLGFTGDTGIGTGLLASSTTVGAGKTLQVSGGLTIDSGPLSIASGGVVSSYMGLVGANAGGSGTVTVTGANAQWNNAATLFIGQTGTLSILDAGKVTSSLLSIGSKGTVNLDGGTLQVASGFIDSGGIFNWIKGTLGFTGDTSIGAGLLASTTTVGSGKTLQVNGGLTIDSGALNIASGGVVNSSWAALGSEDGSSGIANVSGAGAKWISTGDLYIGRDGTGTLTIDNGGLVSSFTGQVGTNAGGSGMVTVTGGNAQWNNAAVLSIGDKGAGTLRILDAGIVTASHMNIGPKGTVTLDGGTLQVASGYIHSGGIFNWIKGTLGLTGDNRIGAGLLPSTTTVGSGKTLQVNGGLTIDNGTLNITSGGVVSNSWAALGSEDGSSGIANVSGAGAQWNNASNLDIGQDGAGSLRILDSGTVTAQGLAIGAKGTVHLDGGTLQIASGSMSPGGIFNWIKGTLGFTGDASIGTGLLASTTTVGSGKTLKVNGRLTNDNGILKIDNGGVVSSAQGAIGYSPGSSGTVTLTGAKSSWRNAGDLSVGYAGTGSLNVLAGAEVSSVDGYIGREGGFGSLAMVSGAGSRWAASGTLYVNNGSLNVGNGGVASSQSAFVGAYAGRTGTVTVTGAGSQWNNTAALYVGLAGAGTLSIENGGLVSSAGGAIGAAAGSSGTVTVTGANSTWRNTGDLGVGQGGSAVLSILDFGRVTTQALRIGTQGTLNLGQGARLSTVNGTINNNTVHFTGDSSIAGRFTNNGSVVGSAGTLRFDNDVSGAGRYAGDIQFNAHYGPGNSPAAVDFGGGHVTFGSDAVLDIEVFGATPGTQYDQLLHIDTLTFNGTLNLIFSDGYVPAPGSLLTLFDFASFSGSLSADHITVSGYDKRLLDFSRLGTDGSLSVTAVPEPAHWALMLAGLVGLVRKTRRQRAAHAMA